MKYLIPLIITLSIITSFSIGWTLSIDFNEPTKVTKSKEATNYIEIKAFYDNRLIQLRTERINHQQYRDSLYTDLETFMIKNK